MADRALTVETAPDGAQVVSDGVTRWRVYVAGPPDERWVFVNGHIARLEPVGKDRARGRTRGTSDMSAPMPATVVKVLVEPGSPVKKGDVVLMLEAMKMELAIHASRDGVVRQVRCQPGELVQPGVNLVELEP